MKTSNNHNISYCTVIVYTVLIALGFILLFIQAWVRFDSSFWNDALAALASADLVGCMVSFSQTLIMRREWRNESCALFKVSMAIHDSGLTDVRYNLNSFPFNSKLQRSAWFAVQTNECHTWVRAHATELKHRFSDSKKWTEFVFLDPDCDYAHVADAASTMPVKPGDSIQQTVAELIEIYRQADCAGHLAIYYYRDIMPESMFLSDYALVMIPCCLSRADDTAPAMEYEVGRRNACVGDMMKKEYKRVRKASVLVFHDGQTLTNP